VAAQPLRAGFGGRRRWLALAMSGCLGVLGSVLLAMMFANADARTEQAKFDERARDYQQTIAGALARATAVVSIVQGFMHSSVTGVTRDEFTAISKTVRDALALDLRETSWVPRVTASQRDGFERAARAEGLAGFEIRERDSANHFVRAADRAEYFPVFYDEPADAAPGIVGFDFGSEPRRLGALTRARDTRRPAATSPVRLNLLHPSDGSRFIIVAPVYGGGGAPPDVMRGVVNGILEAGPLVERSLAGKAAEEDLDVYLFDPAATQGTRLIYWHPARGRGLRTAPPDEAALRALPHAEALMQVADLRWGMLIARPPEAHARRFGGRGLIALLLGLTTTLGLIAYLIAALRHTLRLEQVTDRLRRTGDDLVSRRREVAHLARHDALTGLPNRATFQERLRAALERPASHVPCVLRLDLDRFQAVNDAFGHAAGDALLGLVAARLRGCLRPEDTVARMGGDEFAVLLEQQDAAGAEALARRLVEVIGQPFDIRGNRMTVGASIGIAFPASGPGDADLLMRNADLALHRAKHAGRGTWCFFAREMEASARARRAMEANLRAALDGFAFDLHYQPLIRLRDRQVCGFEALLRWNCPGIGPVSPAEFVPLAEECGLIVPIGHWVLMTACGAAARWPDGVRIAVNLSAAQFNSPTLVPSVQHALSQSGLAPARLELEITETLLLQDSAETLATLHTLKRLGVSISMDDFGTGYSSLSYLCKFPFDTLKIDQSFVRDMPFRDDCRAIVHAVTGMCRNLGITTIAEGVETDQQLGGVLAELCDEAQGYLFSRPVPIAQVAALLAPPAHAAA
jgi:diguanylate cyclase (GGDEF)-like protein